jgi:hypothetical protein
MDAPRAVARPEREGVMSVQIEEFFARVLPAEGQYCLARLRDGVMRQSFIGNSITDLTRELRQLSGKGIADIYYGVGTFANGERTIESATEKKCFYADIDTQPDGAKAGVSVYKTQKEALADVVDKAKNKRIPSPTIVVSSGNGLHLYWTLADAVPAQDWQPTAVRLKACLKAAGLKQTPSDLAVTADRARILRPLGTQNYRDRDNPKAVRVVFASQHDYTLSSLRSAIPADIPADMLSTDSAAFSAPQPAGLSPASSANVSIDTGGAFAELEAKERFDAVKRMLSVLDDKMLEDRDTWMKIGKAVLDAATMTPEIPSAAWCTVLDEASARGAAAYKGTDDVKAYWSNSNGKGFATLSKITIGTLVYYAKQCGFSWADIRWNVRYPKGFFAGAGGTFMSFPGADGGEPEIRYICKYHFKDVKITLMPDGGPWHFHARMVSPDGTQTHKLSVTSADMGAGGAQLGAKCGQCGIVLDSIQTNRMRDIMTAFYDKLSQQNELEHIVQHLGWTSTGDKEGFALGTSVAWEDGTRTEHRLVDMGDISDVYAPVGSLDSWKLAVQTIVSQNRQPANMAILASFASPLLEIYGQSPAVLSFESGESGTGKTTAFQAGLSVWGHPRRSQNSLDDTVNALVKKMEIIRNLPLYWDEVRMAGVVEQAVKLIFGTTQGKGKLRLNRNASLQTVRDWYAQVCVGTNDPLRETVAYMAGGSDAGLMRLFEVTMPPLPESATKRNLEHRFALLNRHYGVAGEVYAMALAKNREKLPSILGVVREKFAKQLVPTPAERFWMSTIVCIYAAAYIVSQIKLLKFDLDRLEKYLLEQYKLQRDLVGTPAKMQSGPLGWVLKYIEDHPQHIIVTPHTMARRRGRHKKEALLRPIDEAQVRLPIAARIGVKDGLLIVNLTHMQTWLKKHHNVPISSITSGLKRYKFELSVATLTTGVSSSLGAGGRVKIAITEVDNPHLNGYFDDLIADVKEGIGSLAPIID